MSILVKKMSVEELNCSYRRLSIEFVNSYGKGDLVLLTYRLRIVGNEICDRKCNVNMFC